MSSKEYRITKWKTDDRRLTTEDGGPGFAFGYAVAGRGRERVECPISNKEYRITKWKTDDRRLTTEDGGPGFAYGYAVAGRGPGFVFDYAAAGRGQTMGKARKQ